VSNLLFQTFSHELAQGLNRFTVQVYEIFPTLKKNAFFASGWLDQQLQEHVLFLRAIGVLMATAGVVFIGMEVPLRN
jgi:hypothetical protein